MKDLMYRSILLLNSLIIIKYYLKSNMLHFVSWLEGPHILRDIII